MISPGLFLRAAFCLVALTAGAFAAPLEEGLVAHWPLNQIKGGDTVVDLGPDKHHALGENLDLVEGRGGKVVSFSGRKSGIYLPEIPALEITGNYSVSFWVKTAVNDDKGGPLYAQPGFTIAVFKGSLRVTFRHPEYTNTGYADLMGPPVSDGEWHHVVLSYASDSGETVLYLDGVDVAKRVFPHKPEVSFPTTVGFAGRSNFQGEMSDLRVYTRTLDSGEAVALHSAQLAP